MMRKERGDEIDKIVALAKADFDKACESGENLVPATERYREALKLQELHSIESSIDLID